MPRRHGSQNKGGKLPTGEPARASTPKSNAGHALPEDVKQAIASLPQIESGEWSKSYLAEQLWKNYLGMPADYDWADLEIIAKGEILV
jgi:hypothetical protein